MKNISYNDHNRLDGDDEGEKNVQKLSSKEEAFLSTI